MYETPMVEKMNGTPQIHGTEDQWIFAVDWAVMMSDVVLVLYFSS